MTHSSRFALATHALALLAYMGDEGATSDLVAASASTHPARVRRVLAPLRRAGIVRSREGVGGGYVLARAPERISLAEVFDALGEGPLFSLHPQEPNAECPVGSGIKAALGAVEAEVVDALRTRLTDRTVAWLTARVLDRDTIGGRPE